MRSGLLDSSETEALAQNEKKLQNQREHLTAWLLFQRVTGEMYGIQTLSELSLAKTEQGKKCWHERFMSFPTANIKK